MKSYLNKTTIIVSTIFLLLVSTTLGLQAEDIKCIDVSGTWVTTEEIDNSDCGAPNKTKQYTYQLVQKKCTVIIKIKGIEDAQAEVRGNKVYWPKREFPGRQSGSTLVLEADVSQVSGNKATGIRHWTWTKGTKSCSGTIEWIDSNLRYRKYCNL